MCAELGFHAHDISSGMRRVVLDLDGEQVARVLGISPTAVSTRLHRALAKLERTGRIATLITQNVDGLHTRAGSSTVIDLHGRLDRIVCLACGERTHRVDLDARLEEANRGWRSEALAVNPDGDVDLPEADLMRSIRLFGEKVIPALGIEKMLDEGVPQSTLDRVAPGVKTSDVNNLFGALDRAIPGLGKVVRQNASVGVAAGIKALGKEAVLEGKNDEIGALPTDARQRTALLDRHRGQAPADLAHRIGRQRLDGDVHAPRVAEEGVRDGAADKAPYLAAFVRKLLRAMRKRPGSATTGSSLGQLTLTVMFRERKNTAAWSTAIARRRAVR